MSLIYILNYITVRAQKNYKLWFSYCANVQCVSTLATTANGAHKTPANAIAQIQQIQMGWKGGGGTSNK